MFGMYSPYTYGAYGIGLSDVSVIKKSLKDICATLLDIAVPLKVAGGWQMINQAFMSDVNFVKKPRRHNRRNGYCPIDWIVYRRKQSNNISRTLAATLAVACLLR